MHPYDHADATSAAYEPGDTRPPRRNRRPVVIAVGALLALLLVPVAVDRFAAARVESRTAEAFQEGMRTPSAPEVHVRGFPVLTQLASGTLRHVDITAHDIPASDATGPLPVSELSLRLKELRKSDDDTEALARSATATALLSYPDLSDALGPAISRGTRPDQVRARVLLPTGDDITVATTVSVLSGNRIAFRDFQVTGGLLPEVGRVALGTVFERPIQLRNIPQGLRLRSVTATQSGLIARLSGESVTFRSGSAQRDDSVRGDSSYGNV
ncbi:LmeA family phospholipid-binding protein [Streptomyces prunicolor]|uniref:LmeA family phospholipid-binding protein n=1 Tax=Streptomyces prunicolor TaxID=67348 RepID=UPI0033D41DB8